MAAFGQGFGAPAAAAGAETQDIKVPGAPGSAASCNDGISALNFAPNNLLLASSWDAHLRVWNVQKQGNQVRILRLSR